MVEMSLLLLWLALAAAGDTKIGRLMRRWLVEWPARILNAVSGRSLVTVAAIAALGVAIFWLLDGEALIIFGLASPELLVWTLMFDIGTLADLIAFTVIASSTARFQAVVAFLRTMFAGRARRPGRTRNRTRRIAPANDDEDRPALPLAA